VDFLYQLKRIINTGQSRSIILTGNVYDLFFDGQAYVPLLDFLCSKLKSKATPGSKGISQLTYELNSPVVARDAIDELQVSWAMLHDSKLQDRFRDASHNMTFALELLRQLTTCNRQNSQATNNLLVMIEAADMVIPEEQIARMNIPDRRRVAIIHDWFSDPAFLNGGDTTLMIAESRSTVHHRISKLPQVISIDIPLPDKTTRQHFINHFTANNDYQVSNSTIADETAGLSIHAIRQLLLSGDLSKENIALQVEAYMTAQLGDGVIEFKRPAHTLDQVVGFRRIKKFMRNELIPGFLSAGDESLSGAAVGGPIGGGKTFICEAVASELGIPVITLKNIRSKWFGETDKIFERLRRLLESFHKIVIFVDEADAQFGSIEGGHETERRLTGKIQAMMSDPRLKGRVIWFLMTARIHRLSPDIRRPGRMDLIIPILDPEGEDRREFIEWTIGKIETYDQKSELYESFEAATAAYSAASFALLRSRIKAKQCHNLTEALAIAQDMIPPDIESTRAYQTLQAKINCTRKSLLFDSDEVDIPLVRHEWREAIRELERQGVS
jgi:ATPase family protein associated with various cellular activities (AAA)